MATSNLLLSKFQASCVLDALGVLSCGGMRLHARLNESAGTIHVLEYPDHVIAVYRGDAVGNPVGPVEHYADGSALSEAYKVNE